jgi:hypothetical protein
MHDALRIPGTFDPTTKVQKYLANWAACWSRREESNPRLAFRNSTVITWQLLGVVVDEFFDVGLDEAILHECLVGSLVPCQNSSSVWWLEFLQWGCCVDGEQDQAG